MLLSIIEGPRPGSTRYDTRFSYTTRFRSGTAAEHDRGAYDEDGVQGRTGDAHEEGLPLGADGEPQQAHPPPEHPPLVAPVAHASNLTVAVRRPPATWGWTATDPARAAGGCGPWGPCRAGRYKCRLDQPRRRR